MLLVEHKSRGKGLDRGLHADGKTYQAAVANVEVIVKEWVQTAKELGRPIPQPRGRLMFA